MISIFPKNIANDAVRLYLGALATVSIVFFSHSMSLLYIALGVMWVCAFFLLSNKFTQEWQRLTPKQYMLKILYIGLPIRIAWVIFSYFYFQAKTGVPFEFDAADSMGYHGDSEWLANSPWEMTVWYLFTSGMKGISDAGYPLYLSLLYRITGSSIFIARIVKCFISMGTCLLIYNIGRRNFGEKVGRMAGIFAMLMPNLIIYCGLHLKETEMIFLTLLFLDRADNLIHAKEYHVWTIAIPILLVIPLFFFRTVLGAVAAFSMLTAFVFTTDRVMGKAKKAMMIAWAAAAIAVLGGGTIQSEIEGVWEDRGENQTVKRDQQTARGNKWAKYATGGVMAPMALFLPYPTMVDVDEQYNQQIMHGGNYVRNYLGIFVLIAIFSAIFIKKNWRDFVLIGAFTVGYLLIISMSGFANAERFLLPGLPGLLIMAAYGVSLLNAKNYRFVRYWYVVVVLMAVGWAFFKLGSRGIVGV